LLSSFIARENTRPVLRFSYCIVTSVISSAGFAALTAVFAKLGV
jgi:hypothetical protein